MKLKVLGIWNFKSVKLKWLLIQDGSGLVKLLWQKRQDPTKISVWIIHTLVWFSLSIIQTYHAVSRKCIYFLLVILKNKCLKKKARLIFWRIKSTRILYFQLFVIPQHLFSCPFFIPIPKTLYGIKRETRRREIWAAELSSVLESKWMFSQNHSDN
jgi:hypothetical protein